MDSLSRIHYQGFIIKDSLSWIHYQGFIIKDSFKGFICEQRVAAKTVDASDDSIQNGLRL